MVALNEPSGVLFWEKKNGWTMPLKSNAFHPLTLNNKYVSSLPFSSKHGGAGSYSSLLLTLAACLTSPSGQVENIRRSETSVYFTVLVVWVPTTVCFVNVQSGGGFHSVSPRCSHTFRNTLVHRITWNQSESHPQILQTTLHFLQRRTAAAQYQQTVNERNKRLSVLCFVLWDWGGGHDVDTVMLAQSGCFRGMKEKKLLQLI